jgi:hypothetical protein
MRKAAVGDAVETVEAVPGVPYTWVPAEGEEPPVRRGPHFAIGSPALAEMMIATELPRHEGVYGCTAPVDLREEAAGDLREEAAGDLREEAEGDLREEAEGDLREEAAEDLREEADESADEAMPLAGGDEDSSEDSSENPSEEHADIVVTVPVSSDEGVPVLGGCSPARVSAPPQPPDEEMTVEELQELSQVLDETGVQVTLNAPPLSMTPLPVSLRPHSATQPTGVEHKMSPQTRARLAESPLLLALAGELPGVPPPPGGLRLEVVEQPDTGGAASSGGAAPAQEVEAVEVDRYMDGPVLVKIMQGARKYSQRPPKSGVAIAAHLEAKSHGKYSFWTVLVVTEGALLEGLSGCSESEWQSVLERAGPTAPRRVCGEEAAYHANHANHTNLGWSLVW